MTDVAKFEQFGLNTFYNGIPILDNASDWFRWNQKVNEFIRISADRRWRSTTMDSSPIVLLCDDYGEGDAQCGTENQRS
jgi:hypothetical protein